MSADRPVLTTEEWRRLFLCAQGLCAAGAGPVTHDRVYALIERMGYVQVDSINVVARAHHLILWSRLQGYRETLLADLAERQRSVFEHWTHDASLIPCRWFPHWHHRYEQYVRRVRGHAWWRERMGPDPDGVAAHVLARITHEGPLRSKDFERETPGEGGGWWSWSPQKAALEFLWRSGRLAVRGRNGFEKVYDLVERVLPEAVALPVPSHEEHVAWACETALERLGAGTPAEVAGFWGGLSPATVAAWCQAAAREGRVVDVDVVGVAGETKAAYVLPDWEARLQAAEVPDRRRMRLLCPFDPILRDRRRLDRLFGFSYRFEAFVPSAQRQHGYYVMPILWGERLVGRLDAKLHRDAGRLEVRGLWWEGGVRKSKARRAAIGAAVDDLASFVGATTVDGLALE